MPVLGRLFLLQGHGRHQAGILHQAASALLLQPLGHQPRPSRLVAGPDPRAAVPVEVLVEQEEAAPGPVLLEVGGAPVERPVALFVAHDVA
jgi:hypothetical protein